MEWLAQGRFGKNIVAQMLCGSQSSKLSKWRLDQLSTFGLLHRCTQVEVNQLLDELIRLGAVEQVEVDRFRPVVQLTEFGSAVMRGQSELQADLQLTRATVARLLASSPVASRAPSDEPALPQELVADGVANATEDEESPASATDPAGRQAVVAVADAVAQPSVPAARVDSPYGPHSAPPDASIMDGLRSWRRRKAENAGVPAFRVLSNAVIERLASRQPATLQELAEISGIGEVTLAQYGEDLLAVLAGRTTLPAKSDDDPSPPAAEPSSLAQTPLPAHYWSWRLLADGYSVQECLQIRRLDAEQLLHELELAAVEHPLQTTWLERLAEQLGPAQQHRVNALIRPWPATGQDSP